MESQQEEGALEKAPLSIFFQILAQGFTLFTQDLKIPIWKFKKCIQSRVFQATSWAELFLHCKQGKLCQDGGLDPPNEPGPKGSGVLFVIFLGNHITLLICPQTPGAELRLCGESMAAPVEGELRLNSVPWSWQMELSPTGGRGW